MERMLAWREAIEYPISLKLAFKTRNRASRAGFGETCSMSSHRLVFTSDPPIERGTMLEISLAWPVLLDDCVPLKLVVETEVVACEGLRMSARIIKYQFRTGRVPVEIHPVPVSSRGRAPIPDPVNYRISVGRTLHASQSFSLIG